MAKKSFLDKAKGVTQTETDLTGKKDDSHKPPSERGLADGYTRYSFVANKEQVEILRALAWYEMRETKEIMEEALRAYFESRDIKEATTLYNKIKKKVK